MRIFDNFHINEDNNDFFPLSNIHLNLKQSYSKYAIINKINVYKYYYFLLIFIFTYFSIDMKKKDIKEPIISKNFKDECKEIKKFMNLAMSNILIDKNINLNNYKTNYPKISIVIPIYNAEKYIRSALTSIQNQDLKDIEIIMVDDFSEDNSVKLINELMKNDPRIKLYENKENKGILYTKAKGVFNSKGKYVIILDEDDIFGQRDAFSTLYQIAEKYDLDMLGFSSMFTEYPNKLGTYIHHYYETPIIFQPNIIKISHNFTSEEKVKRVGDNIWCYLFKTKTLNKTLEQINKRFLNTKMICHEDYLILFLITRTANKFRQIKRIFHVKITYGKPQLYITKSKEDTKLNLFCQSYVNYIEFILIKTNNTINDKKISSFELERYFLNKKECQNNTYARKRIIKVCKLFLKNKYIENYTKKKILKFFHEYNIEYKKTFHF